MTNILELIERARRAGLHTDVEAPTTELPDLMTPLGMPMDPELADLYAATNGFIVESLHLYGVSNCRDELIEVNESTRDTLDDFPMLHNVLICANFALQRTDFAIVPIHADEHGRHPVVIVDTNEDAYIMPLASTLNRGLELLIDEEILFFHDQGQFTDPFPDNAVAKIRQDARLMELIAADAFAPIGGDRAQTQEWYDVLAGKQTER